MSKLVYFWYCVTVIVIATSINYLVSASSDRSWSSSGGYVSTGSGWHK